MRRRLAQPQRALGSGRGQHRVVHGLARVAELRGDRRVAGQLWQHCLVGGQPCRECGGDVAVDHQARVWGDAVVAGAPEQCVCEREMSRSTGHGVDETGCLDALEARQSVLEVAAHGASDDIGVELGPDDRGDVDDSEVGVGQ